MTFYNSWEWLPCWCQLHEFTRIMDMLLQGRIPWRWKGVRRFGSFTDRNIYFGKFRDVRFYLKTSLGTNSVQHTIFRSRWMLVRAIMWPRWRPRLHRLHGWLILDITILTQFIVCDRMYKRYPIKLTKFCKTRSKF